MPQLVITRTAELLPAHEQQIRSFIRLHWHDEYLYDLDAPLIPPERNGQHVILADRHALFSHARVHISIQAFAGRNWQVHCLGDVLTYPAFRRRGYGAGVTAAATDLIRNDPAADFGILFCDPDLADFYARNGWQAQPRLAVTSGIGADRSAQGGLPMVLPVSGAAQETWFEGQMDLLGFGW